MSFYAWVYFVISRVRLSFFLFFACVAFIFMSLCLSASCVPFCLLVVGVCICMGV